MTLKELVLALGGVYTSDKQANHLGFTYKLVEGMSFHVHLEGDGDIGFEPMVQFLANRKYTNPFIEGGQTFEEDMPLAKFETLDAIKTRGFILMLRWDITKNESL
jgi:hypothetical protein